MTDQPKTATLWRPVGDAELDLIAASGATIVVLPNRCGCRASLGLAERIGVVAFDLAAKPQRQLERG